MESWALCLSGWQSLRRYLEFDFGYLIALITGLTRGSLQSRSQPPPQIGYSVTPS